MLILIDVSRAFIRWAADRDMGIPDFAKGLKKPTVHQGKVIYYTDEEIENLLTTAKGRKIEIPIALGAHPCHVSA